MDADGDGAPVRDADGARSGGAGWGRLRRALRRAGFVLQVCLCVVLAVWTATTGEVALTIIAVVLLVVAIVLLVRDVRRVPLPASRRSSGPADLGEGATDDDTGQAEGRQ